MHKYAQMKRFDYDFWFQFYIYNFVYVDPETIIEEDYFPYKKKHLLKTTRNCQLQYQSQKILYLVTYA